MNDNAYRRIFGFIIGTAIGLVFALVSQSINYLSLPGLPLFVPPFGALNNTIAYTLLGALTGLLVAWPENGIFGVVFGSLVAALVVTITGFLSGTLDNEILFSKITVLILLFVPVMAIFVPIMILLRWIAARETTAHHEERSLGEPWRATRLILPVGLVLIAGLLGFTQQYPDYGDSVTLRMNDLIQQSMKAQSAADLPVSLQPPYVNQFQAKANGAYTLQWDKDQGNRYALPRYSGPVSPSIVIARFDNGYLLVCLFTSLDVPDTCKDFNE
jgi:hypothetical protein